MKMKTTPNIGNNLAPAVVAAVLFLGTAPALKATTIIASYDAGSNGVPAVAPDPTSVEGGSWLFFDTRITSETNTLYTVGGLSPDPTYANLNAWRILDKSTSAGACQYVKLLSPEDATNAAWCGWKLSCYCRVLDPQAGNASPININFQFAGTNTIFNKRIFCFLDIGPNGELIANPQNGAITLTTNTTDAVKYHLYELIYDPGTRSAKFLFDGTFINTQTNFPVPALATQHGTIFGNFPTASRQGDGYFNKVTVELFDRAPTTVTLDPTNQTRSVTESVTFSADYTGCATNVQWYKDGSPIAGANNRNYTIPYIVHSDGAGYKMGIADPQTGTEVFTSEATLFINTDTNPPTVVSVAGSPSLRSLRLKFSEGMDPATAQDPLNYQVAGGALTTASARLLDLVTVELQTSEQTANSNYDLILSGIQDSSGNTMLTVTQAFNALNLVPVSYYNAGTAGNPAVPSDPSLTNAGHWTSNGTVNVSLSFSPVADDLGSGWNAWNITDHSTAAGTLFYSWAYPAESCSFALTNGWRYRVRGRFVDDYSATSGAIVMNYNNPAANRYLSIFRFAGINLDLQVQLNSGVTTNVTSGGVGASDYHLHEISFDPVTKLASYYFDGTFVSAWGGSAGSASVGGPQFGAESSAGQGNMNFNLAEFSVVNATTPVIVTNPVSTVVSLGGSATFAGFASGFVGGYQWYKDSVAISNATTKSYTIASATEANEGQYTLRAFNSATEVESTAATLTIRPTVSIGKTNGNLIINFTGTLQSATNATDTFTDVTPAPANPLILTNPPGPSLFFRARK
jgi:hypothetical protein